MLLSILKRELSKARQGKNQSLVNKSLTFLEETQIGDQNFLIRPPCIVRETLIVWLSLMIYFV